ncbi:MAG: hypothetical protein WDA16_03475 [Candidatus Thermoplasmatota archaeon]
MKKFALVLLAIATVIVPTIHLASASDPCVSKLVIFSDNSNVGASVNSNAAICIVENEIGTGPLPANTAFINPASDEVMIRYTEDIGVEYITCHVEGLGANTDVQLERADFSGLGFVYDSGRIVIDAAATGSITSTCYDPDGDLLDEVTFHTVV